MRRILTIVGVGLLSTLFIFSSVFPNKAQAVNCKDVNLIFARGSSQNLPSNKAPIDNIVGWHIENGSIIYDRGDDFAATEKESAKYFTGIGNRILREYPTLTMQFVSLHDFAGKYNDYGFRAVPAFGSAAQAFVSKNAIDARFGYSSLIGESTYGDYRQSIQDGAEELAGYLQDEMTRCPSQYNVVGGFSQGAQVVGDAMALMHTRGQDQMLSRLGHVDLFGDPKFNGFQLNTSRLNPAQLHTTYPWVRGSANVNEVGSLGPRQPYIPDILTAQTTSWCDFNDIVCGGYAGLSVGDLQAHGHVYSETGGWIEKATNETYIAMKKRLSLLAGLTDKSANSPLAYWPGISKPNALDVMFVMDSTGDENLSLVPDPQFIDTNFTYLADPSLLIDTEKDVKYSSFQAGVVTYTEFDDGSNILPFTNTPVNLTDDVFGQFGYFVTGWGAAHFQGNNVGGADLQDSPFSALNKALDQDWRGDARKVIILFSNTWGKDPEPVTGLTMMQITAKARNKHVEILPVFTSKTFRANQNRVQNVPAANAFFAALAKQSKGHATEVTDLLPQRLIYDVIMGHVFAPDVEITTGRAYKDPKTKKATTNVIKDTKPVFKKGKKVILSAAKSSSPKSTITHYAWDMNGDGVIDHAGDSPYVEHTYDTPFDGQVSVTVTDGNGNSTTGTQDIGVTDDDNLVTEADPVVLESPDFVATRSGSNLVITWPPVAGTILIRDQAGAIITAVDGQAGTFTLTDVPQSAFSISLQLARGSDQSLPVTLNISAAIAAQTVPAVVTEPNNTTPLSTTPVTTSDQEVLGATTGSQDILSMDVSDTSFDASDNAAETAPTDSTKTSQQNSAGVSGIKNAVAKNAEAAAKKGAFALSEVVQDFLAWLILMLLFLILLYLIKRSRDQTSYQHNRQKRFVPRKVLGLQV